MNNVSHAPSKVVMQLHDVDPHVRNGHLQPVVEANSTLLDWSAQLLQLQTAAFEQQVLPSIAYTGKTTGYSCKDSELRTDRKLAFH